MKRMKYFIILCFVFVSVSVFGQRVTLSPDNLEAVDVSLSFEQLDGKEVVKVVKSAVVEEFDEPTFVKIKDLDFTNGWIEVKVLSRLAADAPDFSRGFIGVSFRINDDNSRFESFYLRPTNV